tara:strand:- start:179 stop:397 length:219 start_codon:yes stop_codon:yes gene_type:complete
MFSLNKIFWLIIILIVVWYVFKFIEKKNKNIEKDSEEGSAEKKNIDAFKCSVCGLWSTDKSSCNNQKCPSNL